MDLNEFGAWGLSQRTVGNPNGNSYKGQCVSLIQQYLYKVFGVPYKPRGNAKDWASNPLPNILTKLGNNVPLQSGDILVYGSNYGGGYGHIGLIDINNKYYDQNGIKKLAISYQNTPFKGYVCVLRPKDQSKLRNLQEFNVRVDKAKAMVRVGPHTSNALGGSKTLVKGNTFIAVGTVEGESVSGNNIWYKSKKGNYVWSGGLTRI